MKKVYASMDIVSVQLLKDRLERRGVNVMLRNSFLAGAAGDLPPTECWPELWVVDDRDVTLAERLLAEQSAPVSGAPRPCPACDETIEPEFSACWSCGAEVDAADDCG